MFLFDNCLHCNSKRCCKKHICKNNNKCKKYKTNKNKGIILTVLTLLLFIGFIFFVLNMLINN